MIESAHLCAQLLEEGGIYKIRGKIVSKTTISSLLFNLVIGK
jgi:hypothetical protein